jgi:hypothetical protein
VCSSDLFVGKYELHIGMYDQAKLQEYIDIYEPRYLVELFGEKLYNEFISDLNMQGVPKSPNFQFVFNSFYQNINLHTIIQSDGIKTMLKGFIYFEYLKDTTNQVTPNGMVIPSNENSTTASTLYSMMYARYNEAIRSFKAIQTRIMINQQLSIGQVVQIQLQSQGSGYITASDVDVTAINPTNGSGLSIDISANEIGGVLNTTIVNVGSGYFSQMNVTTTGGTGGGCIVNVLADQSGTILSIVVVERGSGYTIGDVIQIDGGNNDAQFQVDNITDGNVTSIQVNEMGSGYVLDEEFTINGGDDNAQFLLFYVGKGVFKTFNGISKQYAYWL